MSNAGINAWPTGECWKVWDKIAPHSSRIMLYGPSGTGKTFTAVNTLRHQGDIVLPFTCTPDTMKSEILGKWKPRPTEQGQEWVWSYGIGARAWKLSHTQWVTVVWNEINHMGADGISALHPILDDKEHASITLDNDEVITPGPFLRQISTLNGSPEELLPSMADRFPTTIKIDSVHPDALASLPADIRAAAATTSIHTDPQRKVSFRAWQEFAKLRETEAGEEYAAKAVCPDRWRELIDTLKLAHNK